MEQHLHNLDVINWIMGAMTLMPRWYRPNRRLGPDAVADEFADYVRRMLAAAPTRSDPTEPTKPEETAR